MNFDGDLPMLQNNTSPEKRLPRVMVQCPKLMVPQNGWFIMENSIKMDDLWVPLFLETPICGDWLRNPRTLLQPLSGTVHHHAPRSCPNHP